MAFLTRSAIRKWQHKQRLLRANRHQKKPSFYVPTPRLDPNQHQINHFNAKKNAPVARQQEISAYRAWTRKLKRLSYSFIS